MYTHVKEGGDRDRAELQQLATGRIGLGRVEQQRKKDNSDLIEV